jgi:hypothetical protein
MKRLPWVERKFQFDVPEGWLPNIIARLSGTRARLIDLTENISEPQAELRLDEKWSIKEHIGHLADLEVLHIGRIDDFENFKSTLRAADMKNARTEEANHNSSKVSEHISQFWNKRSIFLQRLEGLSDEIQAFESIHPRLNMKMKPVDIAYFTAEHDDHHIAWIIHILNHAQENMIKTKQ